LVVCVIAPNLVSPGVCIDLAVRIFALLLSAAISPSIPSFLRIAPNSERRDRAVKVDIGDQPCIAVAPHHVVDIDRLTVRFDDLALNHDASNRRLFSLNPASASGFGQLSKEGIDSTFVLT
jgi:hypothetical protein